MAMTWLGNVESGTFWAHHPWSDFATNSKRDRFVAVLPIHGFADHGLGLPLDVEEVVGSEILRRAVHHLLPDAELRILPALRFGLAPYPSCVFGIDPETAHDLVGEIAASVMASGFKKLVFFSTSPWNEAWIDAASRDQRASLGLQTFVINLSGLNLDFHPGSTTRTHVQAIASQLLGAAPAATLRPGDVSDAGFRPGNWRRPPPCTPDSSLDASELLAGAARRLARLFTEVHAKAPLGGPGPLPPTPTRVLHESTPAAIGKAHLWPDHRSSYLPHLTLDALETLPDKERTLVVIPTGAIEQHGHHLPVGVDAILGQAWLNSALEKVGTQAQIWVAPPITYGKSNEHTGFPGTVYISAKTLRRVLLAQARQLKQLGFRNIALLNTHGGNSSVLVYTLRELQTELGLRAGMVSHGYRPPLADQESEYGFHAGEWETSLMLAVTEGLVRMDQATCEYPARLSDPGELRPESAPATYSWISRDISVSGTMGDATRASPANGNRWFDEASTALAQRLIALAAESR
jgi:creatinine amidohydrolase